MKKRLPLIVAALLGVAVIVLVITQIRSMLQPSCFPDSVFTAEDMRARVDCHPNTYKTEISEDTVVLFAFPDNLIDWAGSIFIIHIPSVSEVILNTEGNITHEGYKTPEGRNSIGDVLKNPELMSDILERAKEIEERRLQAD